MMTDTYLAYVTCEDLAQALAIGEVLVEAHLAACVNILPAITSVFRWEGKVQQGAEVIMLAKTTKERFAALKDKVKEIHSYECPCIVGWQLDDGHEGFLQWIHQETLASNS